MKMINNTQLLEILQSACDKAGSQWKWAMQHTLSPAYVSDVLNGRRAPGESILKALGYEKEVNYRISTK